MFDPRLDLSFEEFCEYAKTGSAPSGPSGVSGTPNHGKTLGVYDPTSGRIYPLLGASRGTPGVATSHTMRVMLVPENTGGDRPKGVLGLFLGFLGL